MSGWDLKKGQVLSINVSEDRYWSLFNYVFSDSCRKRNTYKYGLIKALLDSLFSMRSVSDGMFISYDVLFSKFAENYWNLVVKYDLRQMRKDGRSELSRIERIFKAAVIENPILRLIEFECIDSKCKDAIASKVVAECKRNVVGALYADFEGTLYSFDLKGQGVTVNNAAYDFMLKYKSELEKLNYYSWAKFLETVNTEDVLLRLLDKLELSTPRRSDLSVYREILRREFEVRTCFYCGKKLCGVIHVDHFVPWSFTKEDKIWNFVLACPSCNIKKRDMLPEKENIDRIVQRNRILAKSKNEIVISDFKFYNDTLIKRMWTYARLAGYKEFACPNIERRT